jgi:meso-butanediol dehydrogenase / (S,S)-butanediol dehydrogenase / diacetyl reductase
MGRRLEGKVALITGGGSGIGRATATLFAREGAKVVVADISPETGEATARLIRDGGGVAMAIKTDVTVEEDVRRAVEIAVQSYGQLNILFNNAGIAGPYGVAEVSAETWERVMNVNAMGTFFGFKHGVPAIQASGGGAIINTSSTAGLAGSVGSPIYSAAKGAIVNLTKSMALLLAKSNIRVNCVCPGPVDTPLNLSFFAAMPDPQAARASFIGGIPMGRIGTPEEVAAAVLFLASDDASYITGVPLPVDGGHLAR